jgi:hypothetical protein
LGCFNNRCPTRSNNSYPEYSKSKDKEQPMGETMGYFSIPQKS